MIIGQSCVHPYREHLLNQARLCEYPQAENHPVLVLVTSGSSRRIRLCARDFVLDQCFLFASDSGIPYVVDWMVNSMNSVPPFEGHNP